MANEPGKGEGVIAPVDFGSDQTIAFALAGTVAIPSPFPAYGQVSLGLLPPELAPDGRHISSFYLKIVQVLSDTYRVTRFIRLADLRAVRRLVDDVAHPGQSVWVPETATQVIQQLEKKNPDKMNAFDRVAAAEGKGTLAIEMLNRAMLYVPESAPVLVRTEYAKTAAESVEFEIHPPPPPSKCCCCTGRGWAPYSAHGACCGHPQCPASAPGTSY